MDDTCPQEGEGSERKRRPGEDGSSEPLVAAALWEHIDKRLKLTLGSPQAEGRTQAEADAAGPLPHTHGSASCHTSLQSLLQPAGGGHVACSAESAGIGSGSMAGKTHLSVRPSEDDRVGSRNQIRKVEYVRLIEQALYALGYSQSAALLEEESQVPLETGAVAALRCAVLEGEWDRSSEILRSLAGVPAEHMQQAEFLIQQQKFLEFLEEGSTAAALLQLRSQLTPLCTDQHRLHQLASWLVCPSRDDLLARSGWPGKGSVSRLALMRDLQGLLPPSLMIPERRLERLVEQTLAQQEASCLYHNYPHDTLTLLSDHDCARDAIPTVTTQVCHYWWLPIP